MDIWSIGRRRKTTDASEPDASEQQGGGCFGIVVQIAVWVLSAVLVTVGLVLFLFGVLDFSEGIRFATIVAIIVAPVGIFLLLRVGRAILKDMKDK